MTPDFEHQAWPVAAGYWLRSLIEKSQSANPFDQLEAEGKLKWAENELDSAISSVRYLRRCWFLEYNEATSTKEVN